MSKQNSKSAPKASAPASDPAETDDDDIFEASEFISIPDGLEAETIKRDARRKIEIYWEKKRLREQFEDFDESEFGF